MSDNQNCDTQDTIRSSSSSLLRAPSWTQGGVDNDNYSEWQQAGTSTTQINDNHTTSTRENNPVYPYEQFGETEHPVLSLQIPTVYLTRKDPSSSSYHVYQLKIWSSDCEWSIYRRYSQFYALHQQLKALDSAIGKFYFPPKCRLNTKASNTVQKRRLKLEEYMRCLNNYIGKLPPGSSTDGAEYQQLQDMLTITRSPNSTTATATSSRLTSGMSSVSGTSASSDQTNGDQLNREDLSNPTGRSSRSSRRSNQDTTCSPNKKATVRSLFHNFISLKEKKSEEFDPVNLIG